MGILEQESRRRAKRNEIQRIILETFKVAGIMSVALVAPNVISAMEKLGIIPNRRQRELIRRSVDRMYAQGYLKHAQGGLRLTVNGEKKLRALQIRVFHTPKIRWDGKWRVLIFDIPEKKKKLRDEIRRTLRSNGFLRVQHSVWAYPYDCEDWTSLWKAQLEIGKEILYLVVDTIEGDSILKQRFKL
jgi:DNA-binding transcriptional regulator PaaX